MSIFEKTPHINSSQVSSSAISKSESEIYRRNLLWHGFFISTLGFIIGLFILIEAFGFTLSRISGSHHIYNHPEVSEIINIQNRNGKAVPYQVRQFLSIIEQYNLTLENET